MNTTEVVPLTRVQGEGQMKLSHHAIDAMTDCGIPQHMHGAIIRYYENGIEPGSFLTAVINNDLRESLARADDTNRHRLYEYMMWFCNYAPGGSWGYHGASQIWIEKCREQATA